MNRREKLLGVLAVFGVIAFFGYYLFMKITDPDNAPTLGELWDQLQSYVVRGWLSMRGRVERALQLAGGSSDPRVIATGFIAEQEGFSPRIYADPPDQTEKYSIGYGHQVQPGEPYNSDYIMAETEAFQLLLTDLSRYADCVDNAVKVELSANQKAALYSFCYNEGCGAFTGSTLLKYINNGETSAASGEFGKWVYAGHVVSSALVNRRSDEQQLFNS